jgi:hypothetical protein
MRRLDVVLQRLDHGRVGGMPGLEHVRIPANVTADSGAS